MIRLYSPIFILQLFCLYHAYTNKSEQKWYWIIFLFPFFGGLFYLYHHFYSQRNLDDLVEGVKNTFVNNYKIEQLEKELQYSDTVLNRMLLGDEYSLVGSYSKAQDLYKSCLTGIYEGDPKLLLKIIKTAYLNGDFDDVIKYSQELKGQTAFDKSEEKIGYAWALYHKGNIETSETCFITMDTRFSNYKHRLEYARFLKNVDRIDESKAKVRELLDEIGAMDKYEQRLKKAIHKEINGFYRSFEN